MKHAVYVIFHVQKPTVIKFRDHHIYRVFSLRNISSQFFRHFGG